MLSKMANNSTIKKLIILLVVFALLFGVSTKYFFKTFINDSDETIKYKENSIITYIVKLKENDYYETNRLPQGMNYIANLIDEIELTYDYMFSTSELVKYDMSYSIEAITRVYSEDKKNILYEKKETLLEPVKVSRNEIADYNFKQDINIDYNHYNDFVKGFKSLYGLSSDSDLSIVLRVESIGRNEKFQNPIELDSESIIKIPLSERTINISFDNDNISNDGIITEKRLFNKDSIFSLIIFIVTFICSIVVIVFVFKIFLSILKGRSKYDIMLSRILKENDSIIANVQNGVNLSNYQVINISSFEELRDVHDNIGSPILFSETIVGKVSLFYIINDNIMYKYLLNIDDLEKKEIVQTNGGVNEEEKNNQ